MTEVKPVLGWAVVINQAIDVRTVCPTRRAAIINYLVVNQNLAISNAMTDAEIETFWKLYCGYSTSVTEVLITVPQP